MEARLRAGEAGVHAHGLHDIWECAEVSGAGQGVGADTSIISSQGGILQQTAEAAEAPSKSMAVGGLAIGGRVW